MRRRGLAALALIGAAVVPVVHAGPAAAEVTTSCIPNESVGESAQAGYPAQSLDILGMQRWFVDKGLPAAGTGVVVAVLDSGVFSPPIPLAGPQVLRGAAVAGAQFYHGTAVAGIIAGPAESPEQPIGIAPGASILDVKIYDDDGSGGVEGSQQVSGAKIAEGLQEVLDRLPTLPIKVVNLSVAVPVDVPGVQLLIDQLWKKGVIVVASSGNRPSADDPGLGEKFSTFQNGENAAKAIYPAGNDHVVAVATTADGLADDDPTPYVLRSTAIDVAVPTSGALSYSLTGTPCLLATPATSWAAAEVSGVLAALASAYPQDRPAQLVARLLSTASGRDDVLSPFTGAGIAQPYEALTRPLKIKPNGSYDQTVSVDKQQRAEAPVEEPDPLISTRRSMVWFGVLGGGVLVLALVLRPVLARRRRTS